MKRILFILLGGILVIGALAGAGFAGYRIGFSQGARVSANSDNLLRVLPDRFGPQGMPPHNFDRDFGRGFNRDIPRGGFRMLRRGGGFGIFGPIMFMAHIAFWGLLIMLVYLLFTRSGWRLTRKEQTVQSAPPNVETDSNLEE
jgi:hypothetical protein